MRGKPWLVALAMIVIAVGLGYAGYLEYRGPQGEQCYACQRAIHAHSRTVGWVNGRARIFCCPACALSEHEQEGKPIQVTELTAYPTGAQLSPAGAFVVKGSDLNPCTRPRKLIDADKRAADVYFDRCSPSIMAFGRRDQAEQFAREHGGEVLPFKGIVGAFSH